MSEPPARLEGPPAGGSANSVKPMSGFVAAAWALGTVLLFAWLVQLTMALRPGAQDDLVNGFACQLVAYLLGLFLILRLHAPSASIRAFVGVRRTHPGFYGLAALLGAALSVPVDTLYDALARRFPEPAADTFATLFESATPLKRAVIGLVLVALVPTLEEVFFRGAILQPMRRRHAPAVAVVVSAILFSVAHVEWQKFGPILLVGLSLGLLRVASGSLLPGVLLHATFNGVSFVSMATHRGLGAETPLPLAVPLVTGAAALGLALAVQQLGERSAVAARARERDLA